MINVGLVGANGRMGQAIVEQIKDKQDCFNLKCAIVADITTTANNVKEVAQVCSEDMSMLQGVDVVIDFASPASSMVLLPFCIENNLPVMIGTTGFNDEEKLFVEKCAKKIPIILAPNTSLSVNVLFKIAELVANKLRDFEVEIVEAHHRYKKDAPSGTALKLGELISGARGLALEEHATYSRQGISDTRHKDEIGFSVIRGGDIVGMHDVQFINDGEILSVKSQINNRRSFANGALLAAKFLLNKPAGLYTMFDVLGL
ncbi:MAG: 4-hydroxy-tetrahydrodipicolinate reductase [Neisseriaceae bacterium]|jgi:4-hydroxy-tetrahydrodipicolinate reductase